MKKRILVAAVVVMLAAIVGDVPAIAQEAALPFDVQEKTIAQIQ